MKNLYFLIAAIFIIGSVTAQNEISNEGSITYEQVVKIEIKLDGDASAFADMLPKERKSLKSLLFTPEMSLYQNKESEEDESMHMSQGGANVMIRMAEPENIIFTDLSKGEQIEQREFMTRTFLIEGATQNKWKITGKQKTILDYPCQEAELDGAENKTVAWFTPVIAVSGGPGNFAGLPGMILAVDINDGKNTITATSVDLAELDKNAIEKPKKGKKVTREEYDQVVAEKMKEMGGEQGGGNGTIMIRVQK
ncbi:MAG: GLPGLI family protein [Prolixibacteraceae bacterium]|nr:GLPGLI family protein [Prolixibacteraceae bacterium]